MAVEGNAAFKYDTGPTVHNLQQPLRNIRPVRSKYREGAWSLDRTVFEVITVGSTNEGIKAEIRYESDEPGLMDALEFGADGGQLDYYPDTVGSPTTYYPFYLVEPSGEDIEMLRDRDLGQIGEHEITIWLRRADSGNVDGLL